MKLYYDKDCNNEILKGKTIGILGYGSQGHAHALNLKDSGFDVIVGLKESSKSVDKAKAEGLRVEEPFKACQLSQVIMMLIPDQVQAQVYKECVEPNLETGNILMFAHGFNIHYNQIDPPVDVDVIMVAPKGPGHTVRSQFEEGKGVPSLIAISQDYSGSAKEFALAYASGIGAGRAGIFHTTFKEETETDLFGEQAVLCGGVTELIKAGFETLVEAGYKPEIAYFECLHEMKLIIDLMNKGGFSYMRHSISDTAEYGDYVTGKRIITDETRSNMKKVLSEIQDGEFASKWIAENNASNKANFLAMRRNEREHEIEKIGKKIREMMSWL